MIRFSVRPLTFVGSVLLIALFGGLPAISRESAAQHLTRARDQSSRVLPGFVAHEWGTFTSIAGRDGKPVLWRPLAGSSDLPSFVFGIGGGANGLRNPNRCPKCNLQSLIRMETPVIYFYAPGDINVSVAVDFPQGKITEWYPRARNAYNGEPDGGHIDWGRIRVMPGASASLPAEASASHYYAARDTDAALVRVCGEKDPQFEKFLFYRGVGDFDLPLTVKLAAGRLAINDLAANAADGGGLTCLVFENRNGQLGYTRAELRGGALVVERPSLNRSQGAVEQELMTMLTAEGLFDKEARAMVATWRDSWFEEGLRVFYIVPRALADKTLPLRIAPKPESLVRVLVGRTEVITPEMEQAIRLQLEPLNDPAADVQSVAMQVIRTHGRFAEPILKEVLAGTSDERLREYLTHIIRSARAAVD